MYLDFKSKKDLNSSEVDKGLQKILSKAISGFANADGGVIIIGISDPKEKDAGWNPIIPIQKFEQNINTYLPHSTVFPVEGMKAKSILGKDENDGVLIIYIPKSDSAPHCSMKDKRYYQRIGDSFLPMEHYQIADIFGRRHHPKIKPYLNIKKGDNKVGRLEVTLGIKNDGRVLAKFPYITIKQTSTFNVDEYGISGNGNFGLPPFPHPRSFEAYQGGSNDVVHPNTKLPITKLKGDFGKNENQKFNVQNDKTISGEIAAEGFPLKEWRLVIQKKIILNILNDPTLEIADIEGDLI